MFVGIRSSHAMTSSASRSVQLDALGARHGGALVRERAGDVAHVVEGEDLRGPAGERHHA